MCARPPEGKKRDFSDENNYRVIIEFDSLQERSKSGISVGKVGRKGHMFDQFSEQEFNFTDPSAGTYQGLVVKNFNFSSSLPGPNASLTVMAYMFKESGNITFGNETTEMRKGMLKFNIQVSFKPGWVCAARNSLPYLWPRSAYLATLFVTWPKIRYPIYYQNGHLWRKWLKNHTLWGCTYLCSPYKDFNPPPPPPPGLQVTENTYSIFPFGFDVIEESIFKMTNQKLMKSEN